MLSIRLSRIGKKNQPTYRLIVSEKSKDPWGACLEILGFYNPKVGAEIKNLKEDRLRYWLSKGAHLSDTAHNLLVSQGFLNADKIRIVKKKKAAEKSDKKTEKNQKEEQISEQKSAESAAPAQTT